MTYFTWECWEEKPFASSNSSPVIRSCKLTDNRQIKKRKDKIYLALGGAVFNNGNLLEEPEVTLYISI